MDYDWTDIFILDPPKASEARRKLNSFSLMTKLLVLNTSVTWALMFVEQRIGKKLNNSATALLVHLPNA
jgi:hypothetical protein